MAPEPGRLFDETCARESTSSSGRRRRGRYLAPFAKLLLAVAYLRESDGPRARRMLEQLRDEFPENPLYSREIARTEP